MLVLVQCLLAFLLLWHPLMPAVSSHAISRVAEWSNHNKMTLTNLATVFGPNVLKPPEENDATNMMGALDVASQVGLGVRVFSCIFRATFTAE